MNIRYAGPFGRQQPVESYKIGDEFYFIARSYFVLLVSLTATATAAGESALFKRRIMSVSIKSVDELAKMRVAGALAAQVLEMIGPYVVPGVTTGELDRICHEYIINEQQAIPAPLNYRGFPKSICTSVNQVVCHGIPSDKKILKSGDIINIDVTVIKDGYHGDTSKMFCVGEAPVHAQKLIEITQECLYIGIELVKPGATLGDIGHAIYQHASKYYYSIVREYCGHGIGAVFHEDPQVLHYGNPGKGLALQEGMTFTIEPMLNAGKRHTKLSKHDGWTVETKDGRLSAQWEHTMAVTATGVEVFTARSDERF
mgnify:FL=1